MTLNTSFSTKLPTLQLAVDSTSLGLFKECPRKYYYSIMLGWEPKAENVHFVFGILMHGCAERYHHKKAEGQSHDDALDFVVDWLLKQTWNSALKRPWDSGDSYKNRYTLLRTVVGYLDKYGEHDALKTVILENGKPAVELSFSFPLGLTSQYTGEEFQACGHLDRLATLNDDAYIPDVKTSKSDLGPRFWQGFDPSNQFGMYLLAGQIVYKLPVKGLIIDAAQVLVGDSRFDRKLIVKDKFQLDEFYKSLLWWVRRMEEAAIEADGLADKSEAYPMNETSCTKYNGCQFLVAGICSRSPSSRQHGLESHFKTRIWDPLQRRGDI